MSLMSLLFLPENTNRKNACYIYIKEQEHQEHFIIFVVIQSKTPL